jgi:hypothetical protein
MALIYGLQRARVWCVSADLIKLKLVLFGFTIKWQNGGIQDVHYLSANLSEASSQIDLVRPSDYPMKIKPKKYGQTAD